MKTFILCLLVIIATVNASLFFVPAPPTRDYAGCKYDGYPETGTMAANQKVQIAGKCMKASCDEKGNIQIEGCSPVAVTPPLRLSLLDFSKPFPICCPHPMI